MKQSGQYEFRSEPMDHQRRAMRRAWNNPGFALFHEMGAGKTFTTINLISARWERDLIEAAIVFVPTPIKDVWVSEFAQWCPFDYELLVLESGLNKKLINHFVQEKTDHLKVFVVGIESLSQGGAFAHALSFVRTHKCMGVVDESSKIKNPTAKRTERIVLLGADCAYRLILTGTPLTQGYQDLYSQFSFIDPRIINCKSYTVFKARYCIEQQVPGQMAHVKRIIGYRDTDDLLNKISPFVDTVTKAECMDLPEKIYAPVRKVLPSKEQKKALQQLKDSFSAEIDEKLLTVDTILTRLTRYQQIIGGSFPYEDGKGYHTQPIPGTNPKLEELLNVIKESRPDTKVIIWARFRPEIEYISSALKKIYGDSSVLEFHGGIDAVDRRKVVEDFQSSGPSRFFISNQATGGYGITLTAATLVVYYSNTFSYEDRAQSEDRAHRKGQNNHVTYVDIEMDVIEDRMILNAVRNKRSVAEEVTRGLSR